MNLETQRLILRPWNDCDAEELYHFAKDPKVGPIAGWPVHTSIEHSRKVIQDILSAEESYALVYKDTNAVVGSIGLMIGKTSNLDISNEEGEIGYWIGVPYWGQGLVPEAVRELLRHGFEDRKLTTIWCGYFDGNEKSHRVQEKCGFQYHHTNQDKAWPLMNDVRTEHITYLTKTLWQSQKETLL